MTVSTYEAWVTALRAWSQNPRHDMGGLPALAVDSFPPDTYQRLLTHLHNAQSVVMQRADEQYTRDTTHAVDEYQHTQALLELRRAYARRLQLVRHPGLPDELRQPLEHGVAEDIRRLQQQLEDSAIAGIVDLAVRDRQLLMLRRTRLTVLLDPGYPLDRILDPNSPAVSAAPRPEPGRRPTTVLPPPSGTVRRRTVVVDS